MSKLGAAVVTLIAACSLAAAAAAQEPILERTATSSIKVSQDKYGVVITTTSRRFRLVQFFSSPEEQSLILLEEFKAERRPGVEGQRGVVRVEASQGLEAKKLWSIEQEGDEGKVLNDFYRVTKYGCCDSVATYVYFNLRTGEKVFTSTEPELARVIVPNTGLVRYVTYHSDEASLPPPEKEKSGDLIGVVQYGSRDKVTLRLAVRSKLEPVERIKFAYQNKVTEGQELMLWGVDGKKDKSSFSDFAIVISYGRAGDIVLPVRNDEIDLGKATVPPRFTLEVLK